MEDGFLIICSKCGHEARVIDVDIVISALVNGGIMIECLNCGLVKEY